MSSDFTTTITAYPDGPYLVRGTFRIVDVDGNEIESTRQTVALCRCGRSNQKPWCDSTHKTCNFRDSVRSTQTDPPARP